MSQRNEKTEKRDYKKEILFFLLRNPSGSTITDIANGIKTSRITAGKYIGILEAKNKITVKQIGAYKLYYNVERGLIPKTIMISYYLGIIQGLKEEFTDYKKFKQIGRKIADNLNFPYGSLFPAAVNPRKGATPSSFFNYVGNNLSLLDVVYEKRPKISIELEEDGASYIFSEINTFDKSKDFDVHFFIMSGLIEKLISKFFPKVKCDVEEIDLERGYVKLKLNISY
ncbi:MAG: hypothetical protein GY870_00245 [archaeon]|nr:hypothetical protein [archaeon]